MNGRKAPLRLCGLLLAMTLAVGAAGAPTAEAHLRDRHGQLRDAVKSLEGEKRVRAVNVILDAVFDYDHLAEGALCNLKDRKLWCYLDEIKKEHPEQFAEFKALLKQLVQRAYRKNLEKTLAYDVAYLGETVDGEVTIVHTKASNRKKQGEAPTRIDYRMKPKQGRWAVVDVITEDSSMLRTYRSQFRKIIKKKGFDALLRRMRKKASEA